MRLLLLSANPGRVAATDTLPLLDHELIVQSKEQIKVNLTPNNGAPVKGIVICYGYRLRMWRMITPGWRPRASWPYGAEKDRASLQRLRCLVERRAYVI